MFKAKLIYYVVFYALIAALINLFVVMPLRFEYAIAKQEKIINVQEKILEVLENRIGVSK